jgi:hypothetical protein
MTDELEQQRVQATRERLDASRERLAVAEQRLVAAICAAYADGMSVDGIVEATGLSYDQVRQIVSVFDPHASALSPIQSAIFRYPGM